MRSTIFTRTGSDNLGAMEIIKNIYSKMGGGSHKTNDASRSCASSFGKVVILFLFFISQSSLIYSQCTNNTSQYSPYGLLSPVCGSGAYGNWAASPNDSWPGEYSLVNVTEGSIYDFQTYRTSNSATRFTTITTTGNVALAWGNTNTTTSVTWTATFTGQVRFYTHLSNSCNTSQQTQTRRVRCSAPPAWQTTWVSMNTGASTWCAGETRNVTVTVTNAGASAWTNSAPDVNIGVKWNGDGDYFFRTDANGLVSGATQTYTLTVTAPNAGGTNNLSFDVVNEGNFWFADNSNGAGPGNAVYTSAQITINSPPTVTTTTASAVANFTATSGGNVTATGGSSVTARGVLWGITPGLTMPSASSTSDGAGTGSFTSSITGLSASTIYYYRAYAQNCSGYGYGPENTFVTTGPAAEGFYISGNIVNNGEIISTFDENYLRLTGTSKTITGSGKFTNSKLFADGSITFDANLVVESAFTETFVNAGKSLTIATGKTFKNGTMANYGTLTITGTGIINNTSNWFNGTAGTVTFGVSGTGTITAGANWVNDGTFTAGTGTVEFNGSTSGNTINGTTAFYKATINKGSSTATILDVVGTVTQTNSLTFTNGLLRIPTGGSWTKTGSGPTIGATSGLHVNGGTFTQNGASITNNGLFKTTTGTATIGNSSGNRIRNQSGSSFIIDGAGTVNIAGRLEATGSGSFNQSAGTLNVCTSGNTSATLGSIDMTSGTSFTMTGGAINIVQEATSGEVDYKNLAGTVSITGGTLTIGTAATSASSNFNIQGAMPPLVIDNTTNAKTATINGASTVYGNVTINSSSSLVLNSGVTATVNGSLANSGIYNATGTLNLSGNWVNNGTFTSNAGNTAVFNGSNASTIGGSGANNFYKLTMNKGNAEVVTTLASALNTVTHELILTSGILDIAGYDLDLAANTVSGGLTSASYVRTSDAGVFKRNVGSSATLFPIGNSAYNPATLTNSGTSDKYSIRVIDNVTEDGTAVGAQTTMAVVNRTWMINEEDLGGSNVTLTLGWNPGQSEEINAFDASTAFIAHYMADEGLWDNIGGTVQPPGVIQAAGITSFSPFTVSSDGAFAPLPITLSFFDGTCNPEGNELTWVTSSEQNSSHFDLKRSYDGIKWEHVGQKQGAGNSSTDIEYSVWDVEGSRHEVTYYELHQFDFDNALTVYGPIAVRCENDDSPMNGTLSPNPTIEASYLAIENCPLGEATITLMSSIGQVIYTDRIMVTKKNDVYFIDSFDLTRGSYVVRFQASNGQIVAMKLVKN